jgi:TRAP-type C4-dicarboxylate transport system permease small subunit
MTRFNAAIDIALFHLVTIAFIALAAICFVQVVVRYIFSASFVWAEEVSVLLLMWVTWGGACLAIQRKRHLRILLLADMLTTRNSVLLQMTLNVLAIAFLAFVTFTSKPIIDGMANVTFSSLPWVPMNAMYTSTPAGCLLMIYYLLRSIASDWNDLKAQAVKAV